MTNAILPSAEGVTVQRRWCSSASPSPMSLVEAQKGMTDLVPCNEDCGADLGAYSWAQGESEVIIKFHFEKPVTSKMLSVVIEPSRLSVGLKGQPPILSGALFKPVKAEDSLWCIEDKTTVVVTLFKTNREYEEWWPHVCIGERQIDMKTLRPPSKHMRDLDDGARATVEKLMFDQHQKRQGLPTSEELLLQQAMERMKAPSEASTSS